MTRSDDTLPSAGRRSGQGGAVDDTGAIGSIELFPGSNPHPVMRVSDDGVLVFANPSSRPLVDELAATVGERLPERFCARLNEAARASTPLELAVGAHTYELLAVRLPEHGIINVYGTDVTAKKAIVKFPDQNPNPVFRLDWDGVVLYANPASRDLLGGLGHEVGDQLPSALRNSLLHAARERHRIKIEIVSLDRRYELLPVDVPEFGYIHVYGTDITAVRELEHLHRENERLLLNILPLPIADRLRRGERLIADRFEDVSLLFADIVEFTRMSSGMPADELVGMLNEVFTVFDELVESIGLEKVKTIGDAYMVVGGLPEPRPDHLDRVARMALSLTDGLTEIEAARRFGVQFRIGIHAGPVVAGVIGTKKFIYDIWGDTVNVASRMESTGIPGRIQVSGAVEERLRDRFAFEPRGPVDVKGKGPMPTFFLQGVR